MLTLSNKPSLDWDTLGKHQVKIVEDYAEVMMLNGNSFLVSVDDLERVVTRRWKLFKSRNTNYVSTHEKVYHPVDKDYYRDVTLMLHRFIMDPPSEMVVDHINYNGLDNRRCNLRICTFKENSASARKCFGRKAKSRYKGVSYSARDGRWKAQYCVNGWPYFLGRFDTEEEAAVVYDKKALELYGEFALLNFPEKE
jgi:hypothetical protein